MRETIGWATAAGILVGAAYAASPLTICLLALLAVVLWWACRDLGPHERRLVTTLVMFALAIRAAAILFLFISSDHDRIVSFFWDGDGLYFKQRASAIATLWSGHDIGPSDLWEAFHTSYGWSSYIYVLAYVQYLLGPAPYAVHLLNSTLFVAALLLLYRPVRGAYGPGPAVFGLALGLLLPTLISWSIAALKESLLIALEIVTVTATLGVVRSPRPAGRIAAGAAALAAAVACGTVRTGGTVTIAAGLCCAVLATISVRRPRLLIPVVLIVLLVVAAMAHRSDPRERLMTQVRRAAVVHLGYVWSGGHSYRLLDDHFYAGVDETTTMTWRDAARFGIRAAIAFIVVPLPWQARSSSELTYIPQQMIWYVLVILASIGVVAGVRRDALLTFLLLSVFVTGGSLIAITNGNIGSMVRLRDTLVPFVVWLSGLGAATCASWWRHLRPWPAMEPVPQTCD